MNKEKLDDIDAERVVALVNNEPKELLVFRKTVEVPEYVRVDPVTIAAKRNDVEVREISITFLLKDDKPVPFESLAFWGIASFLPLIESASGLKFLIQADFIPHVGKRMLNYEALWNRWLMQEISELLREVIKYLSVEYPTDYLSVFEYEEVDS